MDGLREPVGDQPAKVYWIRRGLVLLVGAVLVGTLWFVISAFTSGDETDPEAPAPDTTTSASTSPAPDAIALDDPSRPCTADDVTVAATATPEQVTVGAMAAFDVAVEHTGGSACSMSSNAEGTALTVRSGEDVYFDSAWCADLPVFSDADWILQPGDREALQATWTGQRYNDGCEPGENAPAGYYIAEVAVAGISAGETQFQMVS